MSENSKNKKKFENEKKKPWLRIHDQVIFENARFWAQVPCERYFLAGKVTEEFSTDTKYIVKSLRVSQFSVQDIHHKAGNDLERMLEAASDSIYSYTARSRQLGAKA